VDGATSGMNRGTRQGATITMTTAHWVVSMGASTTRVLWEEVDVSKQIMCQAKPGGTTTWE
jgi:hypothetical protein